MTTRVCREGTLTTPNQKKKTRVNCRAKKQIARTTADTKRLSDRDRSMRVSPTGSVAPELAHNCLDMGPLASGSASPKHRGPRPRALLGTVRYSPYQKGGAALRSMSTQEGNSSISSLVIHAASCDRTRCTTAHYCGKIQALLAHSMNCRRRFSPACVECMKLSNLVARCGPALDAGLPGAARNSTISPTVKRTSPFQSVRVLQLTESMSRLCASGGSSSQFGTSGNPQASPRLGPTCPPEGLYTSPYSSTEFPLDHAGGTFAPAAAEKMARAAGAEQGLTGVSPMSASARDSLDFLIARRWSEEPSRANQAAEPQVCVQVQPLQPVREGYAAGDASAIAGIPAARTLATQSTSSHQLESLADTTSRITIM
jgi:hypothetical protein